LNKKSLVPILTVALGGLGIYYLYNHFKSKSNFTTTKKEYFNIGRDFDDIEVPLIPYPHKRENVHHKIGWTIPFTHELEDRFPPVGSIKVSNDSYSVFDDTAREDGFAGNTRAFAGILAQPGPMSPFDVENIPVNSTSPTVTAAIGDVDTTPALMIDPNVFTPRIIDAQNQVLKMIIANTTSVNTILTNIDAIKQMISTYRHKIRLSYEQLQQRNITPLQFQQFLMQIVAEITAKMELPLTPRFTAMLNRVPFVPVSPFM
jgi:hypothetical protein